MPWLSACCATAAPPPSGAPPPAALPAPAPAQRSVLGKAPRPSRMPHMHNAKKTWHSADHSRPSIFWDRCITKKERAGKQRPELSLNEAQGCDGHLHDVEVALIGLAKGVLAAGEAVEEHKAEGEYVHALALAHVFPAAAEQLLRGLPPAASACMAEPTSACIGLASSQARCTTAGSTIHCSELCQDSDAGIRSRPLIQVCRRVQVLSALLAHASSHRRGGC